MDTMDQGNNPQLAKTIEDSLLTIKIITERPSLNNRKLRVFSSNKTMKQIFNDGETTYNDTL